jgi:hypothetical protein
VVLLFLLWLGAVYLKDSGKGGFYELSTEMLQCPQKHPWFCFVGLGVEHRFYVSLHITNLAYTQPTCINHIVFFVFF